MPVGHSLEKVARANVGEVWVIVAEELFWPHSSQDLVCSFVSRMDQTMLLKQVIFTRIQILILRMA